MRSSVTVHMNAPVDEVWFLVSDVTQIGRFSPETFEAEWLDGHTGPIKGARFRGHVKRNEKGPIYWTTCTVVACDPGREFAFGVTSRPFGLPIAPRNTVKLCWSYVLHDAAGGTDVTESFELAKTLPDAALLDAARVGPRPPHEAGHAPDTARHQGCRRELS